MLGEVLRRIRLEQHRTLADVARAARVSMPYLSEVERGRKEASSEILAAICDALWVELSDVLAEAGRGLASGRVRRARVVRLDAAPLGAVQPEAAQLEAVQLEAVQLEAVRPETADGPPGRGPLEAQCLLDAQCLLAA